MPRPPKFTPATVATLLDAIRIGASYESACRAAGIGASTLDDWRHGRFPRQADAALKAGFPDALTRAQGESDLANLAAIRTAASAGDWRAAAWGLERRHPAEYGKRDTLNVALDIRHLAERLAKEAGLDADELLADAERIAQGAWDAAP